MRRLRLANILAAAALAAAMGAILPASAAEVASPTQKIIMEQSPPATTWSREDAAHLLRRAAFSGTPGQIDKLYALGKPAAVDYLLTGNLPPGTSPDAAPFAPVKLEPMQIGEAPAGAKPGAARKKGAEDLRVEWVDRMVHTDRPFVEKMSLFWHGLFTSGVAEVKSADQMLVQNTLFHKEALGNYRTLAMDIIHDPAMLKYLNNNENVKGKPNENLAREFCELFTMGQGNGYTEKDVGQIARAFTGASVQGGKKNAQGGYVFKAATHDDGLKTIFGKTGNYRPEDVVKLVFDRPEPAEHLARRLWEFFVYPDPTEKELAPVVAALNANHFAVAPALRAMFLSDDFYSERDKFSIIKSPVDLLVETIRMLGESRDTEAEKKADAASLAAMGQDLFQPPNVRGWPGGESWVTAATLFSRYNAATELVDDNLHPEKQTKAKASPNPKKKARNNPVAEDRVGPNAVLAEKLFPNLSPQPTAQELVNAAVARFLQRPLNPEKVKVLVDSLGTQPLRLGDKDSETRIRQMIGLLLSTPEYQVE